jgi:hypothetical protein
VVAELVWLSIAVALVCAAVGLMVGSYRRKDSLGPLVALLLLMAAGFPAAVYGVLSS